MLENVLILVTVNVRLDLMATTVDFGQVCIVVVFRYCTLAYDCGLRSGMYWVSLHVLYLGLRLWTSVRHVLWLSSGIVPWATTVDFGQVCIVFLLLYLVNLGYSEDKQRVFMLEIIFILVTVNLRLALMATTRLWTSVGYVLSFSSVIVP